MGLHGCLLGLFRFWRKGPFGIEIAVAVAWLGGEGFRLGIGSIGVDYWAGWGRVGIAG